MPWSHFQRWNRSNSIGLCYLLHCLPGSLAEKAVVFDHLKLVMRSGSRLFGATIVESTGRQSLAARIALRVYNRKGIFSNADDTLEALRFELDQRFECLIVSLVGSVALFEVAI